jgi:hypothetical protein
VRAAEHSEFARPLPTDRLVEPFADQSLSGARSRRSEAAVRKRCTAMKSSIFAVILQAGASAKDVRNIKAVSRLVLI